MTASIVSLPDRRSAEDAEDREDILAMLDTVRIAVLSGTVRDIAIAYIDRGAGVATYVQHRDWPAMLGAVTALQHDVLHADAGTDVLDG